MTAIESGRFPLAELADRYDDLAAQKHDLQKRLDTLGHAEERVQALRSSLVALGDVAEELDHLGAEDLNAAYRQLIEAICVYQDRPLEVCWLL
jgi:hypothetical protein